MLCIQMNRPSGLANATVTCSQSIMASHVPYISAMFLRVLVYFTLQVILTIGHLESEGPYFLSRTPARHRIGFRFLNLLFTEDGNKFLWNTCNFPGVDKTCSRRSEDDLGREVSP